MNYDHRKPWVSHVCIQNWDVKRTPEWREAYGKPVVNDEPEYEGNICPVLGQHHRRRSWCTASGSPSCAAAMPATARPIRIPRT